MEATKVLPQSVLPPPPQNDLLFVLATEKSFLLRLFEESQISFEPVFGAYQSLAQKIEVPFSRIFCFFLQF